MTNYIRTYSYDYDPVRNAIVICWTVFFKRVEHLCTYANNLFSKRILEKSVIFLNHKFINSNRARLFSPCPFNARAALSSLAVITRGQNKKKKTSRDCLWRRRRRNRTVNTHTRTCTRIHLPYAFDKQLPRDHVQHGRPRRRHNDGEDDNLWKYSHEFSPCRNRVVTFVLLLLLLLLSLPMLTVAANDWWRGSFSLFFSFFCSFCFRAVKTLRPTTESAHAITNALYSRAYEILALRRDVPETSESTRFDVTTKRDCSRRTVIGEHRNGQWERKHAEIDVRFGCVAVARNFQNRTRTQNGFMIFFSFSFFSWPPSRGIPMQCVRRAPPTRWTRRDNWFRGRRDRRTLKDSPSACRG